MIEMAATVDIDRPAGEVFEFLSDMANNPRWQSGMRSCAWTSEPPIGVGSTYSQTATFLSKDIITEFEVVEFEPGSRIRITSTKARPNGPSVTSTDDAHTLEPLHDTVLDAFNAFDRRKDYLPTQRWSQSSLSESLPSCAPVR